MLIFFSLEFLSVSVRLSLSHTHIHALLKVTCNADSDRVISHIIVNVQAQDPPRSPPGVKFPQEDKSTVVHRKKNDMTKCDLTCTHKQARWCSEGSPRGGVHGDSPYYFINTSLFNFIFSIISQLCKDGVMSNHYVSVFISGPIAGGPATTLWRLWCE